jgi:predicted nucleotidyltransferase
MIDIAKLQPLIVECLQSLNPDKIILFGSYAYGTPTEESDIDLFLVKDEEDNNIEAKALVKLRGLMKKYAIGFDVLSASSQFLAQRDDPFYVQDILLKGKVLYGE